MKTRPRISPKFVADPGALKVLSVAGPESCAVADWIESIQQAWARSVGRALELGRLLSRARASLPYGSWSRLWQSSGLPFSKRKGEMLVVIGEGVGELNAQNSAQLPSAWNTLYYLARLGRVTVERLIRQGRIHPDLSLRQARALLAEYRPKTRRKTPRSEPEVRLARLASFIRAESGTWSRAERKWVVNRLSALAREVQASAPFAADLPASPAALDLVVPRRQNQPVSLSIL